MHVPPGKGWRIFQSSSLLQRLRRAPGMIRLKARRHAILPSVPAHHAGVRACSAFRIMVSWKLGGTGQWESSEPDGYRQRCNKESPFYPSLTRSLSWFCPEADLELMGRNFFHRSFRFKSTSHSGFRKPGQRCALGASLPPSRAE